MPASLRSENDQLHLGTSDRDQIGINNHLHRNKHREEKMNKGRLIGIAVVLAVVLSGVIIWQGAKVSSSEQAESAEKARNTELQKKVDSDEGQITQLQADNQKLRETADYYFQEGVDQQSAGNLQDAKTTFEAVVAKFPTSVLVGRAQQRLAAVNGAIAKEESDRAAEMQRQQAEQERLEAQSGTEIDFASFSAKARSGGLQVGKRYRFKSWPGSNLNSLYPPGEGGRAGGTSGSLDDVVADLDDPTQRENVLKQLVSANFPVCTIVASMDYNGVIHIHRADDCH
jgi:predicted negative regulator of RcsB-dependent stress response